MQAPFRIYEVGCEDGVYESGLPQAGLTCAICKLPIAPILAEQLTNTNDVELETTFEELTLDLSSDTVEADMALRDYWIRLRRHDIRGRHLCYAFSEL